MREKTLVYSFILCLEVINIPLMMSANLNSNVKLVAEKRLSSRIVWTKYGALRGYIIDLPSKKSLQSVEAFMGIPYAIPPIGKLRFMPPVTPSSWIGIKSALSPGPVCPQNFPDIRNETEALKVMTKNRLKLLKRILPTLSNQSEDCLYLNIFSPTVATKTRLPVLVFIHGESFEWNSGSSYDGSVLASFGNIVVVTINFRLGILGFFPKIEGGFEGNFGLIDQVAALHWIQENIDKFGGDPTNVTLFGHTQGAALVNLLLISPMAKGLFHRAILQSGSALSPWAMAGDAISFRQTLTKKLNCPLELKQNSFIAECLRSKSVKDLLSLEVTVATHFARLGPSVDGIVINSDPLTHMTEKETNFGNYDLLLGLRKLEYCNFNQNEKQFGFDYDKKEKILRTLVRNLYTYHLQEIYQAIINEYTDWTKFESSNLDNLRTIAEILSDSTVNAPLIKVGEIHSKLSSRTYFYNFAYDSIKSNESSFLKCLNDQDLAYIFGAPLVSGMKIGFFQSQYTKAEAKLSEMLINYITNFIKTGNPHSAIQLPTQINNQSNGQSNEQRNDSKSSESFNDTLIWPLYEERHQKYMSFDLKPTIKDHYLSHRLSLWINLIPKFQSRDQELSLVDHHLLNNYNDLSTYDGQVRGPNLAYNFLFTVQQAQTSNLSSVLNEEKSNQLNLTNLGQTLNSSDTVRFISSLTLTPSLTQNLSQLDALSEPSQGLENKLNSSLSNLIQQASYTTALSVTIAIGFSFLVLNALIFVGIFYQKDRMSSNNKLKSNYSSNEEQGYSINEPNYENRDLHILNQNSIQQMKKDYPNGFILTACNEESELNDPRPVFTQTFQAVPESIINLIEAKTIPSTHVAMVNSVTCPKAVSNFGSNINVVTESYHQQDGKIREMNI